MRAAHWVVAGVVVAGAAARALRGRGESVPGPASASAPPVGGEPGTASSVQSRRIMRRRLMLLGTGVVLAAAAGLVALLLGAPAVWVVWSEIAAGAGLVMGLVFVALLGPGARWLAGERRPLDEQERKDLTAKDRIDAVNSARQTLMQSATGMVVIAGVAFTAAGLVYTARTLHTSEQGQITDRYTKAIDQFGNDKLDVRLGGIYALERLATDSPRDDRTVYDVLAAFVREHDPEPSLKANKLPSRPATDIEAALTVIGRRKPLNDGFTADLDRIRAPGTDLTGANLIGADLTHALLGSANLTGASLPSAHLTGASLIGADLTCADLVSASFGAHLTCADLTGADLTHALLFFAHLGGADLTGAHLDGANLRLADLTGADLTGAHLDGADLTAANLRDVRGMSAEQIKRVAKTDEHTRF